MRSEHLGPIRPGQIGHQDKWVSFVPDNWAAGQMGILLGIQMGTKWGCICPFVRDHGDSFIRDPFVWDPNVLVPQCPGSICPRIVNCKCLLSSFYALNYFSFRVLAYGMRKSAGMAVR